MNKNNYKNPGVFPIGEKNDAFAEYFVGQSYLNMLSTSGVVIGNVTFEPGCRNNWHIHHGEDRFFWSRAVEDGTRPGENPRRN